MTTSDTTATTKSDRDCPVTVNHIAQVLAIGIAHRIEAEKIRRKNKARIDLVEPERKRKSEQRKLDDYIATLRLNSIRETNRVNDDFRIRWFLWRAALPISLATDISPGDILFGGRKREVVFARRLCLWITFSSGEFSYYKMGKTLGLDHSTVRHSILTVDRALQDEQSEFSFLLGDVFQAELEIGRSSESYIRGPNGSRSSCP